MAKFTVYFKDKVIQSQIFDSGVVRIGRDETNDLTIDNLTVAPAHAVVIVKKNSSVIKQLNDEFPVFINNEQSKETLLQNNDIISVGKHTIIYNTTESVTPVKNTNTASKDVESLNTKLEERIKIPDANLQVMDGQHIGRVLPLKKSMTRFGHNGTDVGVISRRKDGYFISSLEGDSKITVNQTLLGNKTINLNNNDVVVIDNISMQFFFEN